MNNIWLLLGLVAIYFLGVLVVLLWSRFRSTGTILPGAEEFFLARRNLPVYVLMLSYVGTLYSAFTVVGVPGAVFTHGIAMPAAIAFSIMMGGVGVICIGYKFRDYAEEHGLLSPVEVLRHAYKSRWLGLFIGVITIGLLVPYLSLQLVGLGKLLEGLSDGSVGYLTGVGFIMGVVSIYALLGGMRAIAYTDFIQAILIFIGMFVAVALFLETYMGGIGELFKQIVANKPEYVTLPGAKGVYTPQFFFSMCVIFSFILIQPHFMTRVMMCKAKSQVKLIGFLTIGTIFIAYLPGMLFGLSGTILYPELQESNLLAGEILKNLMTVNALGVVAVGMLVTATLAASMSTADSLLLAIANLFTRDVVRPFVEISRPKQVFFARGIMLLTLVGAFIVGLNPPPVMIDLAVHSIAAMSIFVPTYLGFMWHRRSALASFISIVFGGIFLAYCTMNGIKPEGFHPAMFSFLVSGVIFVIASYILSKNKA